MRGPGALAWWKAIPLVVSLAVVDARLVRLVWLLAGEVSVVAAASLPRIGRTKPTITPFRPLEESKRQTHGSQYIR
jgi:fermentation-respiration switch protein FrsA (DUF1100 family)